MMDPRLSIACTGVVALVLLGFGLRLARRFRLLRDLPTSHPGGVFIGLVEVSGRVTCAQPITSFIAEQPCVWYRYTIEEKWSREVTETERDAQGHTRTTTRTETGWKTVASGGDQCRFDLVDETGQVQVDPAGARVDGVSSASREGLRGIDPWYDKGPASRIMDSDGVRRFSETILPPGITGFVIGQARERRDTAGAEIASDDRAVLFVISAKGEKSVESGYFWGALGLQMLGLLIASVGTWALFALQPHVDAGMPWDLAFQATWNVAVDGAVAFALCWMIGQAWLIQFGLIELRQRVRQGWANIDVQLKRRFDLITRLLPIVQAYCSHEAGAQRAAATQRGMAEQQALAAMRSQLLVTAPGAPGPDAQAIGAQVMVIAEAYPDLKAQEEFRRLHASLVDCEDRIAMARGYFNDIAANWNTRRERVPDCFVAGALGMKAQALMTLGDDGTPW